MEWDKNVVVLAISNLVDVIHLMTPLCLSDLTDCKQPRTSTTVMHINGSSVLSTRLKSSRRCYRWDHQISMFIGVLCPLRLLHDSNRAYDCIFEERAHYIDVFCLTRYLQHPDAFIAVMSRG